MAVTTLARSALVLHPAATLYELVNDVPRYPAFVAGCVGARVLASGPDWMVARLELRRAGVELAFTTRNRLEPGRAIHMELLEGPFQRLSGTWRFEPLGERACKVSLALEFETDGRLLGMAAGRVLAAVADELVNSFTRRADSIHGRAGI